MDLQGNKNNASGHTRTDVKSKSGAIIAGDGNRWMGYSMAMAMAYRGSMRNIDGFDETALPVILVAGTE